MSQQSQASLTPLALPHWRCQGLLEIADVFHRLTDMLLQKAVDVQANLGVFTQEGVPIYPSSSNSTVR